MTPPQSRSIHPSVAGCSSTRQRILNLVLERPGITVSELRQALATGWGALYHHLATLKRAGAVESIVAGQRRLVVPAGFDAARAAATSALRSRSAQEVARHILENPGGSARDIESHTGLSTRVVYYHLSRLLACDLIVASARSHYHGLQSTDALRRALTDEAPHRPTGESPAPVDTPSRGRITLLGRRQRCSKSDADEFA